jgi:hypothetical protein
MYVVSNTIPDIAYDVHQAAIYSHGTMNWHDLAVNTILRYLKGTADKYKLSSSQTRVTRFIVM